MRAGERLAFDFDGVDREQYNAVSARLGLDPESEEATGPCSLPRRAWRWKGRSPVKPRRSFDPQRVGQLECALSVAYYRREWMALPFGDPLRPRR
jgi:hypothetical protein